MACGDSGMPPIVGPNDDAPSDGSGFAGVEAWGLERDRMFKSYRVEFRREMCKRMHANGLASRLARETGVSEATLFLSKKKALIIAGQIQGTGSI
jgi:hypothetical protein